jgi:hypothetical protein
MRRNARQPAELVGAEPQHVVEARIGALEVECAVQLALTPQHAGRELVGEAAIAFGESSEVAIACISQRRSVAHRAENLESGPTRRGC